MDRVTLVSKKFSGISQKVGALLAGKEAGKFGDVPHPSWANKTMGYLSIYDSPQMKKTSLMYIPSSSYGPLRFVLHENVFSGLPGPSHRIVALNRNGTLSGELIYTSAKDAVSIDALNATKERAGLGRSLVLLFAQQIPKNIDVTVHATPEALPFYTNLGFRRLGDTLEDMHVLVCKREELLKNQEKIASTGARKGKIFVK